MVIKMSGVNPTYNKKVHDFLIDIYNSDLRSNPNRIKEIAKKYFKDYEKSDPYYELRDAITLLSKEIVHAKSAELYENEILGAIKGLNIINDHTNDPKMKEIVEESIKKVKTYRKFLDRRVPINIAKERYPELRNILENDDFKGNYGQLCSLYGDRREKDPEIPAILAKIWNQPNIPQLLEKYCKLVTDTRKKNIWFLENKQLPDDGMKHNMDCVKFYFRMEKEYFTPLVVEKNVITKSEFDALISFLGDIQNRTTVLNSQFHIDTIQLAFNSEYEDNGLISRYKAVLAELNKNLISEDWRGYIHRAKSNLYNFSEWTPPIKPSEPIQLVYRVIGFKTKEGLTTQTTIPLNLSYLRNPTVEQREQISNFLKLTDKIVREDLEWKQKLSDPSQYPTEITEELDKMNWLSDDQKKLLVNDASVFAFKVNMAICQNLLTLG